MALRYTIGARFFVGALCEEGSDSFWSLAHSHTVANKSQDDNYNKVRKSFVAF